MAILCHDMVPHVHHSDCRVTLSMLHYHYRSHQLYTASHYHPHGHNHYHSHYYPHYHDHQHDYSENYDFHHSNHHDHKGTHKHSLPYHIGSVSLHARNYESAQFPVADEEQGHSHGFPLHHHGSPANDYDYLRLKIQFVVSTIDQQPLLLYQGRESENSLVLPCLFTIRCYDYPFLIRFHFEPGATSLRGPPAIA
ncbi:MAG TPA: hypothetical protein VLH61_01575, partial [Bacteroidales bacterium]|nr:hypothetical protein [Bacteroidales bacterium]